MKRDFMKPKTPDLIEELDSDPTLTDSEKIEIINWTLKKGRVTSDD